MSPHQWKSYNLNLLQDMQGILTVNLIIPKLLKSNSIIW